MFYYVKDLKDYYNDIFEFPTSPSKSRDGGVSGGGGGQGISSGGDYDHGNYGYLEVDNRKDDYGYGYDDDEDLTVAEVETTVSVESVGFCNCSDLKWIASGGMDSTLKVWDLMTGVCRSVGCHDDSVIALKWHQSLPIIVTAALDNILRLWDARNGSLLCRFTGHNNLILNFDMHPFHINTASSNTQLDVSSNSNESGNFSDVIVTVSDDGTAKVFMIHASQILATGGVNEL